MDEVPSIVSSSSFPDSSSDEVSVPSESSNSIPPEELESCGFVNQRPLDEKDVELPSTSSGLLMLCFVASLSELALRLF